jgi:hypothetical protein
MSNIDLEDPKAKQDMLDAVREICKEYAKMDEARDQVKEIIGAIHDAHGIPKPLVRKVSRLYHKRTAAAFETETSEIKNLYTAITTR